jgi:cyclophilin family peptidyl-prolyl cis-trans isomerase
LNLSGYILKNKNPMNKKILVVFGTAIVIVALAYFFWRSNNEQLISSSKNTESNTPADVAKPADPATTAQPGIAPQMSGINIMQPPTDEEIAAAKAKKTMNATIKTSLGEIKIELFGDKTPKTAANFAKLAQANFYDGIKFHRVIKGFMIQAGDPLTKDDSKKGAWGSGGPGYKFEDEPFTGQYVRGTLAMANSGPNTNGSQFFIMHADTPLPPAYVIFGKVTSGIETVDKIANVTTDPSNDRPIVPPVIESITIDR